MFMANVNKIKYVSGNTIHNGAITNNNVALGVDMDIDYGPTTGVTGTGFYQGVTPNNSGYTIYRLSDGDIPRIVVAEDDNALIFFANSFGDRSDITTVTDAILYFKDNSGYFITNRKFDSITTSGMTLMYDPGLVQSYPKSGTTIYNLGSQGQGQDGPEMTLTPNGASVDFVNEKGGTLRFYNLNDGDGSYATADYSDSPNDFTYNVWFKANSFDTPTWNAITSRGAWQQIGIFGGGYIDFYDENFNVDIYDESGDPQIILNKWYNVTVRHIEGETTQLYLDNVLIGEDTTNTNLYNEDMTQFIIGSSNTNPDYFDGQIGHVAYYNRALSVAEIEKNYNALHNRYYGATTGETMILLSEMTGNNNFGYVILDATTGTALGPIDTGVDRGNFYFDFMNVINHGGYSLVFRDDNNGDYKIQFIDAIGTLIDIFEISNDKSTNFDSARGYVNIFSNQTDGIMKFFNGTTIGTYTWDSSSEEAWFDWNNDPVSRDRTFVLYTRNTNTNTVTWKLANCETGVVSLQSYDNNAFDTEPILYINSNIVALPMYDNNAEYNNSLDIYNTSGTLKHSESLTGLTLNNWDQSSFGVGKMSFIFSNFNDNDVDYHLYTYIEDTNSFITETHSRGSNYGEYNTYYETINNPGENSDCENLHYMLYTNTSNYANNLNYKEYIDYVSIFDGESGYTTNVFANGTSKGIAFDGDSTNYLNDLVDTGDGKLKSMLVTPTGITYTELISDVTRLSNSNRYSLNNDILWQLYLDDAYNSYNFYIINGTTGAIKDSLTFTTSGDYQYNVDTQFDSLYLRNNETSDAWYMCRNQPELTSTTKYIDAWTGNRYYDPNTFSDQPVIVMFNGNNSGDRKFRILSATGISNEFTFPESQSNGWDMNIGRNFITWRYNTMADNKPAMRMYDFSGNTLNDYVSPFAEDASWNFWSSDAYGSIAFVVAGEGGPNGQWGTLVPTILNTDGTTSSQTIYKYNINNYWLNFTDNWWDC